MKKQLILCGAIALALAAAPSALADTKAKKKMSMSGADAGLEITEYVKGDRVRTETRVAGNVVGVMLQQCDLKRMVQINEATKRYFVMSLVSPADGAASPSPRPAAKRGGIVNVTTTLTDTGERKQVLGMTARRIKTTVAYEPDANACDKTASRVETDGWYVDVDGYGDGCALAMGSAAGGGAATGCQDEIRAKTVGTAKLGYPVLLTVATGADTPAPTFEVTEITKESLPATLFDVPAGYTQVDSYAELMTP